MSNFLSVSNKLLSLRGNIRITDENVHLAFEARGEFAFFSATWRIFQDDLQVATIRRKIFSIRPTWEISGTLGEFLVKRKIFSFYRRMYVDGGPYEGATISGSLLDLGFLIEKEGLELAKASGKILTISDRHNIELLSQNAQDILFTVIGMVVVQLDRRDENNRRARNHD